MVSIKMNIPTENKRVFNVWAHNLVPTCVGMVPTFTTEGIVPTQSTNISSLPFITSDSVLLVSPSLDNRCGTGPPVKLCWRKQTKNKQPNKRTYSVRRRIREGLAKRIDVFYN